LPEVLSLFFEAASFGGSENNLGGSGV
jgi:hypothetical protein